LGLVINLCNILPHELLPKDHWYRNLLWDYKLSKFVCVTIFYNLALLCTITSQIYYDNMKIYYDNMKAKKSKIQDFEKVSLASTTIP